mmetsp:Transcript_33302/g.51053  ORF Transcript_33302/g.51053 Transcript_33302/m.51053 type:complete len:148 (-) Transcript_33302:285-728(-)|eukprot:CAMPEP_0170505000 /NCGR_PEP_ID=MMETSP0208-20121228/49544_1 /TAXON_ID=197538 /ORGANISM="Strombidium inclinatum, Strain S3" /LENGTH=147 /DNA_ID=CAMNT_0010785579 /DNA_START=1005 /DNA_END=1448 /DNA_ORIENTATION=+
MIFRENVETEMEADHLHDFFEPRPSLVTPYEIVKEAKKMKRILEKECGRFHKSSRQQQQAAAAKMVDALRSQRIQQRAANLKSHLLNLKKYENTLASQFMIPNYQNEPEVNVVHPATETNDDYRPEEVELKTELRNYPVASFLTQLP